MSVAYDVFISYRHVERDRAWAKWLLESLETYRVPKSLQKKGFPARIGKAFRDEDELPTSSDLSTNIQQALEGSKYLVVICSKDTPSSLWVDKEVQTFRKLGKGDHIIPMLVEGTPETSFPPSLLSLKKPVKQADGTIIESDEPLEPIAADVRERKDEKRSTLRRLALLRILAALLGCAFDDLRQRDHERQARKKRIQYTATAICSLVIAGFSLYLWDYNRVKVAYYNTMVYRWGVPEGVGRLSEEVVKRREISYRISERGRKIVEASRQNSAGMLKDDENGESQWQPFYRADGNIDRLVVKNRNGRILLIKKYNYGESKEAGRPDSIVVQLNDARMNPYHRNNSDQIHTLLDMVGRKTVINRYLNKYDKNGFVTKTRYQNIYGRPKVDKAGVYGQRYEVGHSGLVLRQADLDIEGAPAAAEGVTWTNRTYDAMGCLVEEWFTDGKGETVTCRKGYSKLVIAYDRYCNPVEMEYLDKSGKPTLMAQGYSLTKNEYNTNGFVTSLAHYGPEGKPRGDAVGIARQVMEHDIHGNITRYLYFGPDGKPTLDTRGAGEERMKYDPKGNTTEICFYGTDGRPGQERKEKNNGFFRSTLNYDDMGRMVKLSLYDSIGKPWKGSAGESRWALHWGENDCITGVDFYTNDSLGAYVKSQNIEINRDELGNPTGIRMTMPDGKVSSQSFQFDEAGNWTGIEILDQNGKLIMDEDFAKVVYTYDKQGNMTQEATYNAELKLVNSKSGYARTVYAYDGNGRAIDTTYYDAKGRTVKPKK